MDCGQNERFKRELKEIHRGIFGLSMAPMPARLQNAPRFLDNGQLAPYPSLAVRARNGRVADNPTGTRELTLLAWMSKSARYHQLRITSS
jgi:hypothetical protein